MTENQADDRELDTTDANPADLPYKDDTSDGTTAKSPEQIAEETAGDVKASDDLAREAAGRPHPEEGHDVRDYRPIPTDDTVPDGTQIPTEDDMPAEEGDAGIADAPGPDPAE